MKLFEDRILRLEYEACMEFLSRLPDAQIDENKLVEVTMRIWSRLVPSVSRHWLEHDQMVTQSNGLLDLDQSSRLKVTRKSSVFYRLRLAYAMIKKKEAEAKMPTGTPSSSK